MAEKNPHVFNPLVRDPARRELVLSPRARFAQLDEQGRTHIKATSDRIERLLSRHDGLRSLREQLNADAELSPVGRAKRLRTAGDEILEAISKEGTALAIGQKLHSERSAKLTATPPLDRSDSVSALMGMELRGHLRSMDARERSKLLTSPDLAPEIIDAVLRGPAALSGISGDVWSRLDARARIARHGPEIAKLEAEGTAIAAWRDAIDLVRSDVERAVSIAEREAVTPEPSSA